jgi:hypothetical protein
MDAELKHEQMDANLTASVKLLKHTCHQVSDFRVAQLLHKKFSRCIYIEIETATTSGLWQFGITIEPKKKETMRLKQENSKWADSAIFFVGTFAAQWELGYLWP